MFDRAGDGNTRCRVQASPPGVAAAAAHDHVILEAGSVLRQLMRKTTLLHAVGVNIWRESLDKAGNVRRAFPWLLCAPLRKRATA